MQFALLNSENRGITESFPERCQKSRRQAPRRGNLVRSIENEAKRRSYCVNRNL